MIVNPVIEPLDDETVEINEGCLSVPDLRGDARAPRRDPRPLPRPRGRRARRGQARAHRRDLPARGRPPRRRPVRRPRRPATLTTWRSTSATSARSSNGGARGWSSASARDRMTYWCELAWLGGESAEAGVLVEVGRRADRLGRRRARRPPAGADRLAGLTIPGLANAHSHAFQRALRGRTQAGRGDFWTWRERCTSSPARLDPDALLRARAGDLRRDGARRASPASASSTTSTTGPAALPYDDPNAMGEPLIEAAREAGIRITLLDACYLHGGIGEPPNEVQRRFSDGDADALGRARSASWPMGPGCGSARRSTASVPSIPDSATGGGRMGAARRGRCTPTSPSSRPRTRRASPPTARPRPACSPTPGRSVRALHRRPRHPPHRADVDAPRRARLRLLPLPDDRARPGRRDRARRRALRRAGAPLASGTDSHAVIDLFEEARAVELDERLATRRARPPRPAALLRAATAGGHAASAGPRPGGSRRARSPTSSPSGSTRRAWPARAPTRHWRRPSSPPAPPMCGTSWSAARASSATARTSRSTSPAELGAIGGGP